MRVKFKSTSALHTYSSASIPGVWMLTDGAIVDVSEKDARYLVETFPDNFSYIVEEGRPVGEPTPADVSTPPEVEAEEPKLECPYCGREFTGKYAAIALKSHARWCKRKHGDE